MTEGRKSIDSIVLALKERAKVLNCLYEVDEILSRVDAPRAAAAGQVVERLPAGWQFSDVCCARLRLEDEVFVTRRFAESAWVMRAEVRVRGDSIGGLEVFYTEPRPPADEGPFLKEERFLIEAVADRVGLFVMQQTVREIRDSFETALRSISASGRREWGVILEFLRRTDPELLIRITRKMINDLCWAAVEEAEELLGEFLSKEGEAAFARGEENRPLAKARLQDMSGLTERTFEIASSHLGEAEVLFRIQEWIEEEKSGFLIDTLESPHSSLSDITEAVARFRGGDPKEPALPPAIRTSLRVALLRRLFVDELSFINVAKNHVAVSDFYELLDHLIFPPRSHGQLGGKSAGLFVAACIVRSAPEFEKHLPWFRVPSTWYISSDSLHAFMRYNNLEELYNRKYTEIERVRQEYPHVVQVFKNSRFPPELSKGLAAALDEFENKPLIVRSSSLLEDQPGAAFSGKYKSLFLANQGSKRRRLTALQDAVAEVYASIFSPDPISYRAPSGLLDFQEEMGIMIQEVVGRRVGDYFLPAYAGVAFGNNEFRWSPRIRREDGVVRLVPGLGTRAVDRLSDDYPVLVSPGQKGLRVNVAPDEIARYSPNKIDVINLKANSFETLNVHEFLRTYGPQYPAVRQMVSIVERDRVRRPAALEPDFATDAVAVTFDGLIEETAFVEQIRVLLKLLRERLGVPPDIEFASDGEHFYLLQCRSQSASAQYAPSPLPEDVPPERVVFSASRHISNGQVKDVTHIVYVDPERYAALASEAELRAVGSVVSRLNKLLPRRQFVLIGPGRWGSRGDIRLGVPVGYSDINNTAVLLEVARRKGRYVPELSFGTHFFQDLVEADIRYIPLYPDEEGNVFNEAFLAGAENVLPRLVPRCGRLADTVRVIDVPQASGGRILRILMNADLDLAVGILAAPSADAPRAASRPAEVAAESDEHWRWRLRMAERIAAGLDPARFGVKGMYVFGSAKNGSAGPASDLDLLVHVGGGESGRRDLALWLEGWSRSLAEVNYLRTGCRLEGLLDVQYVTDEDIAQGTGYAVKIDAATDAARPLPLRGGAPAD
ncbi:MAG: nucleotidyltransferase domain-containing protein [Planctomycetes bacterium]|nr:nucleotidyltransferase domain-containing protein [Planctomycetota bacterium]